MEHELYCLSVKPGWVQPLSLALTYSGRSWSCTVVLENMPIYIITIYRRIPINHTETQTQTQAFSFAGSRCADVQDMPLQGSLVRRWGTFIRAGTSIGSAEPIYLMKIREPSETP